jgi:hypothetical protein
MTITLYARLAAVGLASCPGFVADARAGDDA